MGFGDRPLVWSNAMFGCRQVVAGAIRPHSLSIRSPCATDYKIAPTQRPYLNRIVVRVEQMSAAQTIALKARSQETDKTAPCAARPRRLSARRLLLAGATIVVIAGASDYGWYYWTTGRFEVSTDDAYVKADSTIIAPKVGGYLSEVLVRDNQPVMAGQVLAKIDDRDYVVALAQAQARADVAAAQGEIENISATIDQQQAVIAHNPARRSSRLLYRRRPCRQPVRSPPAGGRSLR